MCCPNPPSSPLQTEGAAMKPQTRQHDLFHSTADSWCDDAVSKAPEWPAPPIAIPCGFTAKDNRPCHRLAHRPVMIEGEHLTCRGRPMLFCDPVCYEGLQSTEDAAAGRSS